MLNGISTTPKQTSRSPKLSIAPQTLPAETPQRLRQMVRRGTPTLKLFYERLSCDSFNTSFMKSRLRRKWPKISAAAEPPPRSKTVAWVSLLLNLLRTEFSPSSCMSEMAVEDGIEETAPSDRVGRNFA